ncbi:hypothetical protein [Nonomuraea sp. WAC 01424]|uniref:hypothetical protein n=1 Tax=Nonomuraea sp. WAC 01424 TaxID=2203200 RepID=UPI000F7784E4|nr:hypothetical protein [Nonomuraea sp. WAC 01424]
MAWKGQTDPDAVNAWVKKTLAERDRRAMLMVRDFLWALFIDDYPECARGDALACAGIIPWGKAIGLHTSAGAKTLVQLTAVAAWNSADQRVHNLSVGGIPTYHVAIGGQDALVHNCPIGFTPDTVSSAFENMRKGGGHAMRHLIEDGLIVTATSRPHR